MTTKITEQNISNLANAGVNWQAVKTGNFTAVAGEGYFVNTTSTAITVTLPASPSAGDTIIIRDYAATFGTNAVTINRNGSNIEGETSNLQYVTNNSVVTLVYIDSTKGWITTESEAKTATFEPLFIQATGGTVTETGDYKIHTFTGDGCFVVSQIGNAPTNPNGGPQTVSYLVIAGGGGGGTNHGGGGGAGGYREGRDITPSYTASPLVAPTGLTISATTYPVTVGAGGTAPGNCQAAKGSDSIFSTITSTGGGSGVGGGGAGQPGGSGGGAGGVGGPGGGNGNTPPTSPPQGSAGGCAPNPDAAAGGGGGAVDVGSPGGPRCVSGGPGGDGTASSITGSPVTRAGGGGGGNGGFPGPGEGGIPGPGGGGAGGGTNQNTTSGTANTGGGGGGGQNSALNPSYPGGAPGGNGGKGIVIIRYKYQ